jgi:hypothetical protein
MEQAIKTAVDSAGGQPMKVFHYVLLDDKQNS